MTSVEYIDGQIVNLTQYLKIRGDLCPLKCNYRDDKYKNQCLFQ